MVETPEPDWKAFAQAANGFGAGLTEEQLRAFAEYLRLLREWNEKFNLTAISQPQAIVTKHFLDSLTVASVVDLTRAKSLVDVGSGAGFPGLALKIAFPRLRVTLLDALQKRINFLQRVAEALDLRDVTFVHARAEDAVLPKRYQVCGLDQSLRERFDVVTARAVASLDVLVEWTVPFARVGGTIVALKGPGRTAEIAAAVPAIKLLGGEAPVVRELTLQSPGEDEPLGRSLVMIRKVSKTPAQYPRLPGSAKKQPLGTAPAQRQK
jgi:16S rRNA (guanine527-N7)-methyltransferase